MTKTGKTRAERTCLQGIASEDEAELQKKKKVHLWKKREKAAESEFMQAQREKTENRERYHCKYKVKRSFLKPKWVSTPQVTG